MVYIPMEKEINPNRPDLVFSYWVIGWFVLYIIDVIPYNPKYLFILGIALASIQFGLMFLYQASVSHILFFLLANLLLKGVPLYVLFGKKTTDGDVIAMCFVLALYILWLKVNNKNFHRFFVEFIAPVKNDRKAFPVVSPFQTLLSKL